MPIACESGSFTFPRDRNVRNIRVFFFFVFFSSLECSPWSAFLTRSRKSARSPFYTTRIKIRSRSAAGRRTRLRSTTALLVSSSSPVTRLPECGGAWACGEVYIHRNARTRTPSYKSGRQREGEKEQGRGAQFIDIREALWFNETGVRSWDQRKFN